MIFIHRLSTGYKHLVRSFYTPLRRRNLRATLPPRRQPLWLPLEGLMRSLVLVATLATIAACSGCASVEKAAGPHAAKAVNSYCAQVPYELRQLNRETFNRMIDPNSAAITCAGDPAP